MSAIYACKIAPETMKMLPVDTDSKPGRKSSYQNGIDAKIKAAISNASYSIHFTLRRLITAFVC